MACFSPSRAWRKKGDTGRIKIGRIPVGTTGLEVDEFVVRCGKCTGCKMDYSREWAVRCFHEAKLYDDNTFITLTYSPEHLPPGGTLVKQHFVDFMKRLRARFAYGIRDPETGQIIYQREEGIRVFYCGEYGGKTQRPHYHAVLFNVDFPDKKHHRNSSTKDAEGNPYPIFRSDLLKELWPFGFSEIGTVTFESVGYIARYCLKKKVGFRQPVEIGADPITGELIEKQAEFHDMSRRPGIGREWYDRYGKELWNQDLVVLDKGKVVPVPRYYTNRYKVDYPDDYEDLKEKRKARSKGFPASVEEWRRLKVSEKIKLLQVNKLLRDKVD